VNCLQQTVKLPGFSLRQMTDDSQHSAHGLAQQQVCVCLCAMTRLSVCLSVSVSVCVYCLQIVIIESITKTQLALSLSSDDCVLYLVELLFCPAASVDC